MLPSCLINEQLDTDLLNLNFENSAQEICNLSVKYEIFTKK